jgi:hypothetical protein
MQDAKKDELTFPDWSPDHFDACRLWIYGEDGSGVTMANVVELWHMANFLLLESFQLHLIDYISNSKPNLEQALQLLSLLNDQDVANFGELREALFVWYVSFEDLLPFPEVTQSFFPVLFTAHLRRISSISV